MEISLLKNRYNEPPQVTPEDNPLSELQFLGFEWLNCSMKYFKAYHALRLHRINKRYEGKR